MESKIRVLTAEMVAKELGVSLNLVYRQLKTGTIPSVRVGDRFLISRDAFERWLNGEATKAERCPK